MLSEPGVLDRRVAEDQVEQDAEAAFVGCRDELFEVGQRAELRVDGGVVGHVVPEVGERRRVDGGEPEGVDAEPREVVEPLRDTAEIPNAVTVRVLKRPWVDLIDDRLLPPGQGRKINLIDTPGDPGFQGDMIAALRVVEGALVVVSAVMGVEVQTTRAWQRAEEGDLSRVVVVNMLDRERADFFRTLDALREQLSPRCVAVHLPIGAEHELTGVVDLLHMKAYTSPEGEREGGPGEIPAELQDQVAEYREKLLDSVVETDEALMERYLDGQELSDEEVAHALKDAVTRGEIFPVACAVATKNLGTTALLDLLVEGVPSPAKKHIDLGVEGDGTAAFVFKTIADPFAGRINVFRVISGEVSSDSTLANHRARGKERIGQLLTLQGKEHTQEPGFRAGDIGAVAKLKDTTTGDLLLDAEREVETPEIGFPEPVMSFAVTPKAKGDEDKVATALRRLSEEDPTLVIRRDPQTGEQLLSGLSQMHVEVAVERVRSRFGAEVDLHQPRVPYLETIRKESRAHARYKKQTGGRGQFGDCVVVLEPLEGHQGYEFVDEIA